VGRADIDLRACLRRQADRLEPAQQRAQRGSHFDMAAGIRAVVMTEAPVHIAVLQQRLRGAWDIGRVGARIRENLRLDPQRPRHHRPHAHPHHQAPHQRHANRQRTQPHRRKLTIKITAPADDVETALAIIVASPDLIRVSCRTPHQMTLVNALCRAWEERG
jgi:hypothetical protein